MPSSWVGEPTIEPGIEGKTKIVTQFARYPSLAKVKSKDDITAGNGKRHEIMSGKGELSNTMTVNVFKLLHRKGVPVAYKAEFNEEAFVAQHCNMIPLEVVARWRVEPKSSVLKRNPDWLVGQPFTEPLIEFYLKTKGMVWNGRALPEDDLYLELKNQEPPIFGVYHPANAVCPENELFELPLSELGLTYEQLEKIRVLQVRVAIILRDAFLRFGIILADFKGEYGFNHRGDLLLADEINNDSWRVSLDGTDVSKQAFRDEEPLELVKQYYEIVAQITEQFNYF